MPKRSDKDARIRRAAERAMDDVDELASVYGGAVKRWDAAARAAYESAIRALKAILREVK